MPKRLVGTCLMLVAWPWIPVNAAPPEVKFADGAASRAVYDQGVAPLLKSHCAKCHGETRPEGDLDLPRLDPDMKASTSAARWAVVLAKVSAGEMPPQESPQLKPGELHALTEWIQAELKRSGKHVARRAEYANGNAVPHELLFGPRPAAPFDAPTSVRRVSPEIYSAFAADVGKGVPGVTQPFSPAGGTTFKDMGAPRIDEPVTALLIRNALAMADKQIGHKLENGEVKGVGFTPKEFLKLLGEPQPPPEESIVAAVKLQFDRILRRPPTAAELEQFVPLFRKNLAEAGPAAGLKYSLAAVYLLPEAVFRWELGTGTADEQGRVRLAPREIAYAVSYALTDSQPGKSLLAEADQGLLETRDGVAAAVRTMLDDPKLSKPRIMRFFREYFDYEKAVEVFKDDKAAPDHDARALVDDTDRLVQLIVDEDRDVLRELLTTNKSFVAHKKAADVKKRRKEELAKYEAEKAKNPTKFANKKPPKVDRSVYEAYNLTDFPDQQPVELPREERAGILTQPAWLVAFSKSDDNDVIHRGKWVRERLLGNVVPDIPITVDAQLPIAPEKTLRERVAVTEEAYCWQCHQLMNRVGLPFESYSYLGRFRAAEPVLDIEATAKNVDAKGKALGNVFREVEVNSNGAIEHVGDERIEGEVTSAVEMLRRLADSERVEQVFIRHAFRYFLGRNETPGDAPSLQAAQRAYRDGGGSMKALITSLLTSDSFLYRIPTTVAPPVSRS
ncbi:MAG: DUF1588 domain-containing protein [Pirellulaceae bacterium]|nr:DUF1588 domain-containing protein [Pirellulaceae bacterium]